MVGVMKMDVEGSEYDDLKGVEDALRVHEIRDVVIEDHNVYPTKAARPLENTGYTLVSVHATLLGLTLSPPAERATRLGYHPPTFLATRDPDRALPRLGPRGGRGTSDGFATPDPIAA
jgi:hypothetical protein